ncbi:HNH endonuclease [Acinetobacter venetianus]|uniref:HNH endonuclease n=1 Tax=Acinetobacter venetianus TaxID=52133 RepID=UPI00241C8A8F|nr:HNH endonuclease [Acinetobacter venetianus]
MQVCQIPSELQTFIDTYNKKNYQLWNDETNKDVQAFRSLIRTHYLSDQKLTCFYCKQYIFSTNGLHWQVEHILPKSLFPQFLFDPRNLIVICPDCNREKSDQNPHVSGDRACSQLTYPRTSGRFKIIHPLYDTYEDHIERVPANHCNYPDHYFLKAHTTKGKATVKMCDLNRFYQEFAGYKDMKGKQVKCLDDFLEQDLNTLTKDQKKALVQKIMDSM